MRKTVIYCDKCGAEIEGTPIQILPEHSDRHGDSQRPYLEDEEENELPPWIERMLNKEFCEECIKKIFDFALNNTGADEKEPDQEETESGSGEVNWDAAVERIKEANQSDGTQCQGAEAIRRAIEEYGIPVKCGVLALNSSNNLLVDV